MTAEEPTPTVAGELPAWVRELAMALLTHPQILLTGNVRDQYPLLAEDGSGEIVMHSLQDVIMRVCRGHRYGALGEHSALDQRIELWRSPRPNRRARVAVGDGAGRRGAAWSR